MGDWEPNLIHTPDDDGYARPFPADFSAEERAFAEDLRAVFSVEREELPPLYVSTLAGDEHFAPLTSSYEQKVSYHVFSQLRMPRLPLFGESRRWLGALSWSTVLDALAQTSRPLLGAMGAAMLMMAMTIVMASPSFAAGLSMLLGQTGATQVLVYPKNISHPAPVGPLTGPRVSAQASQTPTYWLGQTYQQLLYQGLIQLPEQEWSQGPIAEVQYDLNGITQGNGIVDIREFRLSGSCSAVLQVVQVSSAQEAQLNDGTSAVFVDGQWIPTATGHSWQYGQQAKLIFERDGVIFWLSADQRDGFGVDQLVDIANHLAPATTHLRTIGSLSVRAIASGLADSFVDTFSGELYDVMPQGVSPESGMGTFVLMQGRSLHSLY